jgi:hypothetical protein
LSQERPDVCPAGCRKLSAVHNRLNVKAKAAGRSAYLSSWSRPEVRVVERFARALAGRRYSATRQATEDCHRELDRLRRLRPRDFAPRTYHAVRVKLVSQARGLGWTGCGRQMLKPERRIFEDCVRGLVSGRTRTVAEATRVYFGRLQHLQHRLPALRVKTARTIKSYLLARVHEQGRWRDVPWTKQETSIAERYGRALAEGRYASNDEAAEACRLALRRVAVRRRERGGPCIRAFAAVNNRVSVIAARLALPRARCHWTDAEKQIVDRYARAVLARTYIGPAEALEPCYADVCRHIARLRTSGGRQLGVHLGRSRGAVGLFLSRRARELGFRGTPIVFWTPAERRICESWIRWYAKHRVPGRKGTMSVAVEGLQEELGNVDFTRSASACEHRIRKLYHRGIGMG